MRLTRSCFIHGDHDGDQCPGCVAGRGPQTPDSSSPGSDSSPSGRPCDGCDSPPDDRRWLSIDGVSKCACCAGVEDRPKTSPSALALARAEAWLRERWPEDLVGPANVHIEHLARYAVHELRQAVADGRVGVCRSCHGMQGGWDACGDCVNGVVVGGGGDE